MKSVFKTIAWIGLVLTAIGPILVFTGAMDVELNKKLMTAGMIVWFVGAVPWLGSKPIQPTDTQVEI